MGMLLSIPLAGVFGTVASSCLAGLAFCFTSTAGRYIIQFCISVELTVNIPFSFHVLQIL